MVVYGGAVVCGSVWWCMVVYGGVRWWIYPDASASLSEHSDDSTKGLHGGATHPIPTKGGAALSDHSDDSEDNLFVGKLISQDLDIAPKEELFRMLRLKGHTPYQRNSRHGNIQVVCKVCNAKCISSTYRSNAWYATVVTPEVGKQCGLATPALGTKRELSRKP
jgi:hypothetical protein